jgi:hypothetical protein
VKKDDGAGQMRFSGQLRHEIDTTTKYTRTRHLLNAMLLFCSSPF